MTTKTLTPAEFADELQAWGRTLDDASEPLTLSLEVVADATWEHIRSEETPGGVPWPDRKLTLDVDHWRVPRSHHPLLRLTGKLAQAAIGGSVKVADRESAEIGVDSGDVRYAAIHHFGGETSVWIRTAAGGPIGGSSGYWRRIRIPQREFVGASMETVDDVVDVFVDWLTREIA